MRQKYPVLLAVSMCLVAGLSNAQIFETKNKKISIGYSEGQDLPLSTFGSTDMSKLPLSRFSKKDTNDLSGYAITGFHFDIFASYAFLPYLSVMVFWGGDALPYNINELNSQYQQYVPSSVSTITSDNSYLVEQYLAGPYLQLPISPKFIFEFRALAGITVTDYPSLTYISGYGASENEITTYALPNKSAFGYNVGTGIKFLVADGIMGLHLDVDYAASTITYPGYSVNVYTLSAGTPVSSATYNVPKNLAINLVLIKFGVSAEF